VAKLVGISEQNPYNSSSSLAAGRVTHAEHLLRGMPKRYPSPLVWGLGQGAYNPILIKQKLTLKIFELCYLDVASSDLLNTRIYML
jgi:hypothetical protein